MTSYSRPIWAHSSVAPKVAGCGLGPTFRSPLVSLANHTITSRHVTRRQLEQGFYETTDLPEIGPKWLGIDLAGTPQHWVFVCSRGDDAQGFWTDPAKLGELPWSDR